MLPDKTEHAQAVEARRRAVALMQGMSIYWGYMPLSSCVNDDERRGWCMARDNDSARFIDDEYRYRRGLK